MRTLTRVITTYAVVKKSTYVTTLTVTSVTEPLHITQANMQSKPLVFNYKWNCDVVDLLTRTAWTIDNIMATVHPAVVNAMSAAFFRQVSTLHCKKRFVIFPSPAGLSLTKLSLAGNNLIIPGTNGVANFIWKGKCSENISIRT